ncbi:MAG: sigma-70 family RNA polymerase sigma factor [Saprospiraceae bacterium]|nr:sigma-70 family RNA polymerase sigma factor [Saprospiraceae bacterium]
MMSSAQGGGFLGLFPLGPCKSYASNEALFKGLERLDHAAVQCLISKSKGAVSKQLAQFRLPADLVDDVLSEAMVILLSKIQKTEYQYQGHAPSSFFIEIARRVAQNYTRTNKGRRSNALDEQHHEIQDDEIQAYFDKKDRFETVERLLVQMGNPCNDLIRLRYLDGYKDEEVIAQRLTSYTSVESLKVSRSQCMKRLRQMATQALSSAGL